MRSANSNDIVVHEHLAANIVDARRTRRRRNPGRKAAFAMGLVTGRKMLKSSR